MNKLILAAAVLAGIAHPVVAQEKADTGSASPCYYAGQTYSPNASIREGDHILTCSAVDSVGWFVNEEVKSVSCIYASDTYALGSRIVVGSNGYNCDKDGTWKK